MAHQRVAIVTGGARGIGAGIARRLSDDGMKVAILDLVAVDAEKAAAEIAEVGGETLGVEVDVSDAEQVTAAVDAVADALGAPTVLINNAGITRDNLLHKMPASDWDLVMNVHLRGAFLMTQATQKHMIEAGWGRVVNMSSMSALGNRGQANYAAAKAGLQGFTKTAAIELGRFGVTVNSIAPGFIVTDMTAATAERMGVDFREMQRAAAKQIPVGRVGQPADIAHAASFFCSDAAGFVSGQVLYVSGGPNT
ncbi:3-oxoacyl-ACP reductase FabG [Georgenia ruanii]